MPVILQHEAFSWLPTLSLYNFHFDSIKKNNNHNDDDEDEYDESNEDNVHLCKQSPWIDGVTLNSVKNNHEFILFLIFDDD